MRKIFTLFIMIILVSSFASADFGISGIGKNTGGLLASIQTNFINGAGGTTGFDQGESTVDDYSTTSMTFNRKVLTNTPGAPVEFLSAAFSENNENPVLAILVEVAGGVTYEVRTFEGNSDQTFSQFFNSIDYISPSNVQTLNLASFTTNPAVLSLTAKKIDIINKDEALIHFEFTDAMDSYSGVFKLNMVTGFIDSLLVMMPLDALLDVVPGHINIIDPIALGYTDFYDIAYDNEDEVIIATHPVTDLYAVEVNTFTSTSIVPFGSSPVKLEGLNQKIILVAQETNYHSGVANPLPAGDISITILDTNGITNFNPGDFNAGSPVNGIPLNVHNPGGFDGIKSVSGVNGEYENSNEVILVNVYYTEAITLNENQAQIEIDDGANVQGYTIGLAPNPSLDIFSVVNYEILSSTTPDVVQEPAMSTIGAMLMIIVMLAVGMLFIKRYK